MAESMRIELAPTAQDGRQRDGHWPSPRANDSLGTAGPFQTAVPHPAAPPHKAGQPKPRRRLQPPAHSVALPVKGAIQS